ncbi:MAG: hypothetical protein GF307_12550 [candidate division Zixibacteria bacterium]|nr:hypothetical protein [candidate division Zixibacteria bacterium]
MRNYSNIISIILLSSLTLLMLLPLASPLSKACAGGHGDTGALEYRVDTENLTGIYKFLGDLYNDNRTWFAVVTTVWMALLGGIIAILADFILKFIFASSTGTARGK